MVAVDAELRQVDLAKLLDPGEVEVATAHDGIRPVAFDPVEQVAARRLIGEHEQPHLHGSTHARANRIASVRRLLRRSIPAVVALLIALAAGAALLSPPTGAQDVDKLRRRAESKRTSERELSGDISRLGRLLTRLQGDIAVVERRRSEVRAELAEDRAKLDELRGALRGQRARVQRLREHLRASRAVLGRRLQELYRAPEPDLLSVVLSANDFADLLDQAAFLERIAAQDRRIIRNVQAARADANAAVARLARAESAQQETTEAIAARSNALAGISASLAARQADYAAARRARSAALSNARTDRKSLEARIAKLEARRASYAGASSGGPWAIPWPIVQCESGGQNTPPNSAGASGYYQIMPATWRLFGGSGPAAYRAPKAEQDRVAARIWNGGRGASNWVCAALVAG
jgi:peptidoglycan hydrolase CwlO-like protein